MMIFYNSFNVLWMCSHESRSKLRRDVSFCAGSFATRHDWEKIASILVEDIQGSLQTQPNAKLTAQHILAERASKGIESQGY